MKLLGPHFEIWEQCTSSPVEDMWKHIARCTRVCYQSEKKDNNESEEEFVKRVILRHNPWNSIKNHLSVLEHGTVYLKRKIDYSDIDYNTFETWYEVNPYSRVNYDYGICYITTNFRVIVENELFNDLKYICAPTDFHTRRVTVSFITNVGVTREFNRHRVHSPSEESTRYCNYNKRQDGQIKFTLPAWLLNEENLPYIESHQFDKISSYCEDILENESLIDNWCDIDYYLFALTVTEFCYNSLIAKDWTPQKAREVLPFATKSQLVHTAFVDDWKRFFALRAEGVSGPPHPNARLLAKPLKEEFIKRNLI